MNLHPPIQLASVIHRSGVHREIASTTLNVMVGRREVFQNPPSDSDAEITSRMLPSHPDRIRCALESRCGILHSSALPLKSPQTLPPPSRQDPSELQADFEIHSFICWKTFNVNLYIWAHSPNTCNATINKFWCSETERGGRGGNNFVFWANTKWPGKSFQRVDITKSCVHIDLNIHIHECSEALHISYITASRQKAEFLFGHEFVRFNKHKSLPRL